MPVFQYTGRNNQGQSVDGNLEANSADAVATQLLSTGVTPINITQADKAQDTNEKKNFNFDFSKNKKPTLDDLTLFARQMYTLMHAGVPIIRAITGLSDTTRNLVLQKTLRSVRAEIEGGHELSTALAQYPDIFSHLFISMVQVGENTGNLDEVFLQIAGYLEREKETRNQIKSAMRYPTFVLIAITVAMFIINMWVIPTFAKVFAGFGAELPLATRILLGTSEFTVAYWPVLLGSLIIAVFGTRYYVKTEKGHWQWDRAKTRIPIVGSIILRATLSRFARSFSMALSAGVPLVTGLGLVSRAVDNVYVGGHIADMRNGIERGDTLTRTAASTQMFTPLIIQMLTVGEETGNVDDMLNEVADFYDREVDYDVKNLTSAIEPILIVFIGAMVLVLALGVFLPMWDLMSAAKGR
ncbi:MAG: type II secretion system F family protein [Gammaproteobacteria bacterium]|nr:type II secretion system F family protein [Gammaproteobacteria bacterium]MCW8986711.1 type II secretion system F family protein [Gammaproteobacteria bacterium]MCW9032513.1 type II secretion system F family protein [Gammaproteobacteria bacterium]